MKGWLIALVMEPFLALFFLGGPVFLALVVWRYMPDCWLKRFLFTSYGDDNGPWMKAPWQRKRRVSGRGDVQVLPRK